MQPSLTLVTLVHPELPSTSAAILPCLLHQDENSKSDKGHQHASECNAYFSFVVYKICFTISIPANLSTNGSRNTLSEEIIYLGFYTRGLMFSRPLHTSVNNLSSLMLQG